MKNLDSKKSKELDLFIKQNWAMKSIVEMADEMGVSDSTIIRHAKKMRLPKKSVMLEPPKDVKSLRESKAKKDKSIENKKQIDSLLKENEKLAQLLGIKEDLTPPKTLKIEPHKTSGDREATAFVLASDWHLEQKVDGNKIMYPNEYNLEIAEKRAKQFFQATLIMLKEAEQNVKIHNLVLWLGGDFITGNIHTENLKICMLGPAQAICFARDLLISGIEFLLKETKVKIVIPYNHGNHARITDKVWKSTEEDNSLEYILYDAIAFHFKGNPRIEMVPPKGSVAMIEVYGLKICFVHGHHGFRYLDGVGGLYIPARKYVMRKFKNLNPYLIVMGHHHQYLQDTYFICNGSMIGYDQYADSCGFPYDIPKQTFFLIESRRKCRTVTRPILFDD